MSRELSPSIQEWQELYNAAIKFQKIECWDWMYDTDIFGVQNPVNREIGYCCVLGNLGKVFGLVVYLGIEGLGGYLKLQSGEVAPEDYDSLHTNKCITASFDNREYLQKQDLEVIKNLGLKFKGDNAWPLFRSYEPGYYPWYITSAEAKFLTLSLQQAMEIAQQFKSNPKILTSPTKDYYLTRMFDEKDTTWKSHWIKPVSIKKIQEEDTVIDYTRLDRIKQTSTCKNGIWEIDFFYLPGPIREKGNRPYYPYVFLWVDHHTGFVFNFHITPHSTYKKDIPEQFLSAIEKNKVLPEEIMTKKEESFEMFKPLTDRLGIKLKRVGQLAALEEAKKGMAASFRRQK